MKVPKTISATQARNNFFRILKESFLEKQPFIVEKGQIPLVCIVPLSEDNGKKQVVTRLKKMQQLLTRLEKFRRTMGETEDSVKLLREMRRYGR